MAANHSLNVCGVKKNINLLTLLFIRAAIVAGLVTGGGKMEWKRVEFRLASCWHILTRLQVFEPMRLDMSNDKLYLIHIRGLL
jgi:hypothetical protein